MNDYALTYGKHAEKDAIMKLEQKIELGKIKIRNCRRLRMYIFAIGEDLKMSKPCCQCQILLASYWHWFSRIYYSTGDEDNILDTWRL